MAAKKSKSIIPAKAQIPVMVIGAIVLVIILVWRINGIRKQRQGETTPTEQVQSAQTDTQQAQTDTQQAQTDTQPAPEAASMPIPQLEDETQILLDNIQSVATMLNDVRSEITAYRSKTRSAQHTFIALTRNPFSSASVLITQTDDPTEDNGDSMPEISLGFNDKERQARLDALNFQGTLIAESYASAVINGQVISAGDTVDGFYIDSVKLREIILSDDAGVITLYMEEVPKF